MSHLARRGRARHLVLFGAMAFLDARLARRDTGAQALLSDLGAGHRLRHHLLLGRPDDDDGVALYERSAVPRCLHPPSGARRLRRKKCRSRRATLSIRSASSTSMALTLCASRWRAAPRRVMTSALVRRRSRTIETSRPSYGTRRALPRSTAVPAIPNFDPRRAKETLNRWIAHETAKAGLEITKRSKLTSSTTRRLQPIASSGISIATGILS